MVVVVIVIVAAAAAAAVAVVVAVVVAGCSASVVMDRSFSREDGSSALLHVRLRTERQ